MDTFPFRTTPTGSDLPSEDVRMRVRSLLGMTLDEPDEGTLLEVVREGEEALALVAVEAVAARPPSTRVRPRVCIAALERGLRTLDAEGILFCPTLDVLLTVGGWPATAAQGDIPTPLHPAGIIDRLRPVRSWVRAQETAKPLLGLLAFRSPHIWRLTARWAPTLDTLLSYQLAMDPRSSIALLRNPSLQALPPQAVARLRTWCSARVRRDDSSRDRALALLQHLP